MEQTPQLPHRTLTAEEIASLLESALHSEAPPVDDKAHRTSVDGSAAIIDILSQGAQSDGSPAGDGEHPNQSYQAPFQDGLTVDGVVEQIQNGPPTQSRENTTETSTPKRKRLKRVAFVSFVVLSAGLVANHLSSNEGSDPQDTNTQSAAAAAITALKKAAPDTWEPTDLPQQVVQAIEDKGGTDHKIPDSIANDCSRDVSGEINKWLKGLPSGTSLKNMTRAILGPGCYLLDADRSLYKPGPDATNPVLGDYSGINIVDKDFFVLAGESMDKTTIQFGPTRADAPLHNSGKDNQAGIGVYRGSNIIVRNLTVNGSSKATDTESGYKAGYEYQRGFVVIATQKFLLKKVAAVNTMGDGIQLNRAGPWDGHGMSLDQPEKLIESPEIAELEQHARELEGVKPVADNKVMIPDPATLKLPTGGVIDGARIKNVGRQGFAINTANGLVIKNSEFINNPYWPIDAEQHIKAMGLWNIDIFNNYVKGPLKYGFVSFQALPRNFKSLTTGAQITNPGINNVRIINNVVDGENNSNCYATIHIGKHGSEPLDTAPIRNILVENNSARTNDRFIDAAKVADLTVKGNLVTAPSEYPFCDGKDSEGNFAFAALHVGVLRAQIIDNRYNFDWTPEKKAELSKKYPDKANRYEKALSTPPGGVSVATLNGVRDKYKPEFTESNNELTGFSPAKTSAR